MSKEIN